jgi:hypothetical protein
VSEQPFQGLSVDFLFAGVKSKWRASIKSFMGLNGETYWILVKHSPWHSWVTQGCQKIFLSSGSVLFCDNIPHIVVINNCT